MPLPHSPLHYTEVKGHVRSDFSQDFEISGKISRFRARFQCTAIDLDSRCNHVRITYTCIRPLQFLLILRMHRYVQAGTGWYVKLDLPFLN